MKLNAIIAALLLLAGIPASGREPFRIHVTPSVSIQPAAIVVRVFVEPHDDNRVIEIVAESGQFLRSSQVQVEGGKGSLKREFHYRNLPAGDYEVRATLIGRDGRERGFVRSQISVLP